MRFIIDAQLPRILQARLGDLGHDASHVKDLPNGGDTADSEITAIADAEGRVVVTKDSDFRHTHETGGKPHRLLHIKLGNMRNRDLLDHVSVHHEAIVTAFDDADFVELAEFGLTLHRRH